MTEHKTLGIFCGGGPAPGLNGVISAATIEARNRGMKVVGLMEGLRHVSDGDCTQVRELEISDVSRIHFDGGSILGISRRGNVDDPEVRGRILESFEKLGIDCLLSIGGDGTAHAARRIAEHSDITVVHVPKTIDNDIPLPGGLSTFGFQTARDFGTELVQSLMEDARTCGRWFLVITMGRNAGHLALGIGKAAGAPLTLIPEEFQDGSSIDEIARHCEASMIRRLADGRRDGVIVMAEGLSDKVRPEELMTPKSCEVDVHGHIRLIDLPLGMALRQKLSWTFERAGANLGIMEKNVGYELRCKNPVPFDIEYTRDLGYGAIRALSRGERNGIVCRELSKIRVVPFDEFVDPETGRTRVRYVDLDSESYQVSLAYQIRLHEEHLKDPDECARLASAIGFTPDEFRERYERVAMPTLTDA